MDDVPSFANIHMTHCTTIKSHDYSWDCAFIVMGDAIENHLRASYPQLQDHGNLWLHLRWCLHGAYVVLDDGCYLKLFAKVRMSHYSTIRIYDYSWHGLYVTMDDAVWSRSGKSTCIHGRLQDRRNLWLCLRWCAQCHGWCYLKSIAKARMTHSRTIESMIIAETVLTLSWTILFEIACESTHEPLQEH